VSVRRSFRGSVEGPRPLGAIIMVAAATATLDITGQVAVWALLGQALGLGWALSRRELPVQRNAPLLNGALALIVALGLGMWLRGAPAVVALAHFATLAQALQLVDARPRRSEFLLVTLALFQVILASNLTDSVLFPPLLVVFLLTTVWTLLVHTLQVEALESGDPLAAQRIATPGLLRAALVASSLSILLALALFLVLPRMRSHMLHGTGGGLRVATSGFSDTIQLGELGRIRQDPRAVLHVETLAGTPAPEGAGYWRGLAFDRFDGRSWSVTPPDKRAIPGSAEIGIDLAPRLRDAEQVQRIVREPVTGGVVFSRGPPTRISGALRGLERDSNGGLYSPRQADQRVIYTVASRVEPDAPLPGDRALETPDGRGRHLQLPPLAPWVEGLARSIVDGVDSDAERAARLERWLRRNGRYSNTPPDVGDSAPIEAFLQQGLEGHCEYFASAMVVLLRSAGIPSRMVNGFAGGHTNRLGGFVTLTRADAHAWVEVHFERTGWVRFDPTPPDLRRSEAATGLGARMSELASAVELWWFQRVVDFDRTDQAHALRGAWLAWRRWRKPQAGAPTAAPEPHRTTPLVDARAVAAALAVIGVLLAGSRLRRRRRSRGPGVLGEYAAALRLLARRGLVRDGATPARAFARRVARELPQAAESFARLTESYLAARFGGREAHGADEELRLLRDSLRA
jgi:transglutaminase-like putative cysteine protease